MRNLKIKDYSLSDFSKFSSKFVSDVTKSFLDNILYIVDALRKINSKHERYKVISDQTFDFLYSDLALAINTVNVISGYESPESGTTYTDGVSINRNYGVVTLDKLDYTNLISMADQIVSPEIANISNDDDGTIALNTSSIYKIDPINPTQVIESDEMRYILDGSGTVWYEITDEATMEIGLLLADSSNKISYLNIYPYGGTAVDYIEFKNGDTPSTTVDVIGDLAVKDIDLSDSVRPGYPVSAYVNKQDFTSEIRIHLRGYDLGDGQYFYSIGKIEPYVVDTYGVSGYVTYDLSNRGITTINDIELSTPYIYPRELEINFPINIKIWNTTDPDNPIYTTTLDEYPLSSPLTLSSLAAGEKWLITFTFTNISNISPVFRTCTLT